MTHSKKRRYVAPHIRIFTTFSPNLLSASGIPVYNEVSDEEQLSKPEEWESDWQT